MIRSSPNLILLQVVILMTARAQDSPWTKSTMESMSLEQKVGQLFMPDLVAVYSHRESPVYRYALEMVRKYHVGGFILAGGTVTDIAMMTNALQRESAIPLVFNADLEGGLTFWHPWWYARGRGPELPKFIPGGGTGFPSLMALGATDDLNLAAEMGRITAREARAVGIHWTNSPVSDVNTNPDNPIINTRSFGEDPQQVARFVSAYVRGLQAESVVATLKHFPGHGDTEEDTHMGLPKVQFDLRRLEEVELVPFRAGIEAGAKAVMTAHIALPKLDPNNRPATLSPPIMTDLLRERLGFKGLIITDGMTMQGVTDNYSPDEAAIRALEAGADLILVPEDFNRAFAGVVNAVKSKRLSLSRIESSVRRILAVKEWLGLQKERFVDVNRIATVVGSPESEAIAQEISDKAVTLLRNENGILPLRPGRRIHLVTITESGGGTLGIELRRLLAEENQVSFTSLSNESTPEKIQQAREANKQADVVIVVVSLWVASWKGKLTIGEPLIDFLHGLHGTSPPTILAALGDPYVLRVLPTSAAILACYHGSILAERSLGKTLLGRSAITGRLPVTIPGRFRRGDGLQLIAGSRREGGIR